MNYLSFFWFSISGTFCEKDTDCKDACCVLEPTINSHLPICKPMLDEYHQCAAILYRKIWIGDKPDCGPCKPGLECIQKGWVTEFFFRECVCRVCVWRGEGWLVVFGLFIQVWGYARKTM